MARINVISAIPATETGITYYAATYRGTEYCAHTTPEMDGKWYVSTRRLALGRWNTGGGRYYESLADMAAKCRAYAGLDVLLNKTKEAA